MRALVLIPLLLVSAFAKADNVLLTGEITSAKSQVVTAPKGDRWQIMIQWMAEEGTVVNAGDLVAVFDSGGIESQLEQNEQSLAMAKLELQKITMDLNQAVTEAEGRLKLAEIQVKKARIEASVEDATVTAFDKGKYQIAYEQAILEKVKAEQELKLKQAEREVGIQKQNIEILRLQEDIDYQSSQLEKLSVKADITGPVSHMQHPWNNGQKIAAGTNVEASWKILTVQAQSSYQVSTWLHETDAARFDLNNNQLLLTLDAYPGKTYKGKVLSVAAQAETKGQWSDSAYYRAEIAFAERPQVSLFPGMSVRVEVRTADKEPTE